MKLLLQIMILTSMLALSACGIQGPQHTSSGRAAYGNAVPDFKANKKQNQKRKKEARQGAKRKKTRNNGSYFDGRPY
jgi:hypothetical protein